MGSVYRRNEIVIADDKVANDPFLSAVITGAVPKHLKAEAMTLEEEQII